MRRREKGIRSVVSVHIDRTEWFDLHEDVHRSLFGSDHRDSGATATARTLVQSRNDSGKSHLIVFIVSNVVLSTIRSKRWRRCSRTDQNSSTGVSGCYSPRSRGRIRLKTNYFIFSSPTLNTVPIIRVSFLDRRSTKFVSSQRNLRLAIRRFRFLSGFLSIDPQRPMILLRRVHSIVNII